MWRACCFPRPAPPSVKSKAAARAPAGTAPASPAACKGVPSGCGGRRDEPPAGLPPARVHALGPCFGLGSPALFRLLPSGAGGAYGGHRIETTGEPAAYTSSPKGPRRRGPFGGVKNAPPAALPLCRPTIPLPVLPSLPLPLPPPRGCLRSMGTAIGSGLPCPGSHPCPSRFFPALPNSSQLFPAHPCPFPKPFTMVFHGLPSA